MNNDKIKINFDEYITEVPDDIKSNLKKHEKDDLNEIRALIPGSIISINVKVLSAVKKGDVLLILEAMKMKNRIYAEIDGIVGEIAVKEGERAVKGQLLIKLK